MISSHSSIRSQIVELDGVCFRNKEEWHQEPHPKQYRGQ